MLCTNKDYNYDDSNMMAGIICIFPITVIYPLSILAPMITQLCERQLDKTDALSDLYTDLLSVMNCLQALRQKQDEMFAFDRRVPIF